MFDPQTRNWCIVFPVCLAMAGCGGGGGSSGSNQPTQPSPPSGSLPPAPPPLPPGPPPAPTANLALAPLPDADTSYSIGELELGFGLGFQTRSGSALTRALAIDSIDNRFTVDLTRAVRPSSRPSGLGSFIEGTKGGEGVSDQAYWTSPPALSNLADRIDYPAIGNLEGQAPPDEASAIYRWHIAAGGAAHTAVDLSFNGSSSTSVGLTNALAARNGEFLAAGAFLAPHENLYGRLSGATLSFAPIENATVSLAGFIPSDESEEAHASVQKVELSYKTPTDIEMRLGYGWMQEDGAWLGSQTSGAFAQGIAGSSEFATASLLAPLNDKLSLFGAYTYGTSSATASSGLISDWSKSHSNAFGVGLLSGDLVAEGDRFSLIVGQPHRVNRGQATLTVPTAIDGNGRVVTEAETVDLSPEGREVAIESTYQFGLGEGLGELATGAFLRLEPNHDPDAEPDIGVGLRYQKRF